MALSEVVIQLKMLAAAVWSVSPTGTSVFLLPISVLCPLVVGRKTQAALILSAHVETKLKSSGIPNALAIC